MNFSLSNQWFDLQQKASQVWESKLAPRYLALEEREQRIVRIAVIVIPIVLFIFGILLPAADKNTQLHLDLAKISIKAEEASRLADLLASKPLQGKTGAQSSPLTRVDKIARQTGVRSFMTKLRPQQGMNEKVRLQIQIKNAPYSKVTTFISTLEKKWLAHLSAQDTGRQIRPCSLASCNQRLI